MLRMLKGLLLTAPSFLKVKQVKPMKDLYAGKAPSKGKGGKGGGKAPGKC